MTIPFKNRKFLACIAYCSIAAMAWVNSYIISNRQQEILNTANYLSEITWAIRSTGTTGENSITRY